MKKKLKDICTGYTKNIEQNELFSDVKKMIDSARQKVATEINSTMSALYWEIGNRINQDLLKNERAEYGKQTISTLARQLQSDYGTNSFSEKNLRRMMQFANVFPDRKIVATLLRQICDTF